MTQETTMSKAARLQKIVHLLYRNPRSLTTAEMARHCAVSDRTVQRELKDLTEAGIPIWDEDGTGRHGSIQGYYLPPVHFDLQEAGALCLAARLLARHSD
jgi:predicted DNA-binding transcriptional regulator YafY